MRNFLILAALLFPASAQAQMLFGNPRVVDGDTLAFNGSYVRLHGIDAVERDQECIRGGERWRCGEEAGAVLSELVARGTVNCRQMGTDQYGRAIAICSVDRVDLGKRMVQAGLAVALPQYSRAYVADEQGAKAQQIGIWASEFEQPADYRAAHPQKGLPQAPQRIEGPMPTIVPTSPPNEVYFRNCREARAAGYAPMYRGQRGYRPEMDGDNDGIACEPYRGR